MKTMWQRIQDTYRYLDDNGLAKLVSLLKFGNKKIWHGSYSDWDSLPQSEKDKYDISNVIGTDSQGLLHNANTLELDNMEAVDGNTVHRAFTYGQWGNIDVVSTGSAFSRVSGFVVHIKYITRGYNHGLLMLQINNGMYGKNFHTHGSDTDLVLKLPYGWKMAPGTGEFDFPGNVGVPYAENLHTGADIGAIDGNTFNIMFYAIPSPKGPDVMTDDEIFLPYMWMTIPLEFDDQFY